MAIFSENPIRNQKDLTQFETALPIEKRLTEQNIYDVFTAQANDRPDKTAITMIMSGADDEEPRRVSYGELLKLIRRAANMFTALAGPQPGVAYLLPSLVETHVTLWGAETAGYAVPINFLLQPEDIAALLKASGAKILVALGPHPQLDIWQKALRIKEEMPEIIVLRVALPNAEPQEGVVDFGAALMTQPDDHLTFDQVRGGDDVAAYFHTGGTTGTPKLVAHTHRGQLVAAFGGAVLMDMRPNDVLTGTFPLFHVAGTIACGLSPFMAGMELLIMSPGGLRTPAIVSGFWRLVSRHKATLVGGVPTALGAVLEVPLDGADLGAVRAGFTGAALLPPVVSQRFKDVTSRNLFEVYGMTEASGLISADPFAGEGQEGSVGIALPYTRVEIRRMTPEGKLGALCDAGEIGVIAIVGENVSPGNREQVLAKEAIKNAVLDTGDLGFKDADGYLRIAGRSKDVIIRSGHNIDPAMIENAMSTHPAVAMAAAVGMPDAYAGELPVCFVSLREGATISEEALKEHAQQTIGERPAWPKHIYIVDTIPVTTVGKIFKPVLRCDAARAVIEGLLRDKFALPDAHVSAVAGGPRGMKITVNLESSAQSKTSVIEAELGQYLFESEVTVA